MSECVTIAALSYKTQVATYQQTADSKSLL